MTFISKRMKLILKINYIKKILLKHLKNSKLNNKKIMRTRND
nr:MAG TPA: hypothetical protein [Caudoviricetes sp.]